MSPEQHAELIAHAREAAPNECCGYLTIRDGAVVDLIRAENSYGSPRYGFELGRDDLIAMTNLEEAFEIGIYHSHPRSEAVPSQQDRNAMAGWPGYLQVIVSATHEPAVRAWWISDRRVAEEPVEIA